jgi:signal transduction histidine kinase
MVFLIGLFATIGWKFDILIFKNIFPALPVIAPNTAVALALSGISLWLLQEKRNKSPWRFLAYLFALTIAILGVLTFIEYISGLNLGFENIIFKNALGTNNLPVRMSPQSAALFSLLGFSLLLINRQNRSGKQPSQYIILGVGVIALFSFFGFINNIPSFYTIAPYKGMAAHTSVAFALLFIGIFLSRPTSGLMKIFSGSGISGFVARRLFITLFILMAFDIFAMAGHAAEFYSHETEAIIHAFLIIIAFIYLMFIGFGSLDKIQTIEEIDRAKTEFVSFVSHQLRNPLTAIKWSADNLLNDSEPLSEKQKGYLSDIHNSADQTINLTNAFLNVSKIEQGTFAQEIQSCNLPEVSDDILKELQPSTQKKELNIIKEYGQNTTSIRLDPKMARIILQNLITNAIQYTPAKGQININISAIGNKLKIMVKDTGIGIPPAQQENVFKKLFRAQNVKKETQGSGLGLYMVKTLLEQINGRIWFESKEGQGTTFYADIPIS